VRLASIKEHLRPYLQEGVKRVVTHNNWGEYGHHERRLVNPVVRELVFGYKPDIYALGVQVHLPASEMPEGYENVTLIHRILGLASNLVPWRPAERII
jgi:hypothetical protein